MLHYQDLFYHHLSFGTTIVHSVPPFNHVHGIAIALSSCACSSWKAACSVFHPIFEHIIRICLSSHQSYVSVLPSMIPPTLSLPVQKLVCTLTTSMTYTRIPCTLFYLETWSSSWMNLMLTLVPTLYHIVQRLVLMALVNAMRMV